MGYGKVAAVLLAAGRGTRFGGNKLESMLGDTMLGLYAAQTLVEIERGHLFAVHNPANRALAEALTTLGFTLIDNIDPAAGLSRSLSLAASAAQATDTEQLLVCLADMPFVTVDHLNALIKSAGNQVVASAIGNTRMPPAIFPRAHWSTLNALTGDSGARTLLRDAICIQSSPDMLADIDTRADLNRSSQ
jgi:molybdenum cofactor cytidylyltransferase